MRRSHRRSGGGKYVGPDDLAAYAWLASQPDAQDVLVLNNLDQGTGWLYPVTGVTPMFPFYRANEFSDRQRDVFWGGVAKIGADPAIDQIVRDMNVHYVIDSPDELLGVPARPTRPPRTGTRATRSWSCARTAHPA